MGPFVSRLFALLLLAAFPAQAQKTYDPGASDTQIRIGNLMPYSGAFSEYGVIGRAEAAYFRMLNDRGGINGRQIKFISLDNAAQADPALVLARRLVEQEQVLFFAGTWGSQTNKAIRPYLNEHHIPHLFVTSNDQTFDDPGHFPWTMGFSPSKFVEAAAYGRFLLRYRPEAKIAVLYSEDEEGAEYRAGLREGLGARAGALIIKEVGFRYGDKPEIEAKVAALKKSGADVFMNFAVGRFAIPGIRAAYDTGWKPLQFLPNASLSIEAFLGPAGAEKAVGIINNARSKGWNTANWRSDPAVRDFLAWFAKYNPTGSERDAQNVYGYLLAQTLEAVLRQCGDDLTRANVMKQATHLDLELGMLRPGIRIHTSPTDYRPIKDLYYVRFNGQAWMPVTGALEH